MSKTVVVSVPWIYKHPKYIREVPRRTKYFAHDEHELCQIGDMVRLAPSRRRSSRLRSSSRPPNASAATELLLPITKM